MTVKYRVKTKHTKELLKEFVKFSFRVNHPKTTFRLFVIGVGFLIIGTGMEDHWVQFSTPLSSTDGLFVA